MAKITKKQQPINEENYRAIFELSPDAIAVHDGQKILLINPAGVKMLGAAKAEDVIGKPILSFIHHDDHTTVQIRFALERQGQSVPVMPSKMIRVDGSMLDVEVSGVPYPYQGKPATLIFVRDITERKQADEALRQSESALRHAQHFAQMGSWTWDVKTNQLKYSDEMYAIFGIDKATFSGSLADVIAQTTHPDDLAKVAASNLAALRGEVSIPLVYRIIRKDGSIHIIHAEAGEVILDEMGKPAFMHGTAQDITERKRLEAQREREQGEKEALINSTNDLIWSVSSDLKLITANNAFYQSVNAFTGGSLTPGDTILSTNLYKPEMLAFWEALYREVLTGKIVTKEFYAPATKNAAPNWLELNLNPIIHESVIVGVACFGRDITERKQAELAVRKSESRLHQAAQLAGLGIWDWDAVTDRVEWSGEMFRIYGIAPEEFTGNGSDYFQFTRADYRELQQQNTINAFERGITESDLMAGRGIRLNPNELCIVRPDGTECYTLGDAVCIVDENGNPLRMLGVTQDITERKKAQEALLESEERYRDLFENMNDGFASHKIILNESGQAIDYEFLSVNPIFAGRVGMKPEDMINHTGLELFPRTEKVWIDTFAKVALTGEPIQFTSYSIELDKYYESRIYCPRPGYFAAIFSDITERKQAESAQARLTAILEATPDFISTANPSQEITYLNRAGRKMIGIDENEDITGLKIGDISPVWATEIIKQGLIYASKHGTWSGETARLTRDGHEFPVAQVILAHKNNDGVLEYFSTICRDITESKRAEEKIRRQLDHLTALSEIDRAITSSFDLSKSLKTLLRHVTRQLGVDAAEALIFDADTQTLKYLAGTGFRTKNIKNFSMSSMHGHAGHVISERRMVSVANLHEHPENFVRAEFLADDAFVSYFGVPLIAKDQIKGVLEIFNRTPLDPDEEWLDFLNALAEQAAIAVDNAILFSDLHNSKAKLEQAYDTTLDGWSKALDLRDKETEGHTRRVTELTLQMARRMGFSENELIQIKRGGLLHDIGKMGIPDAILLKPGALTEEEWAIMRKHTTYAYEMLSPIEYLQPALDIPYCHHERWDGSGYPRGLKGEEIPMVARIFSVVDVWDALRSDRPYRKAWEKEKVVEYISSLVGKQFDPAVVAVFLEEIGAV